MSRNNSHRSSVRRNALRGGAILATTFTIAGCSNGGETRAEKDARADAVATFQETTGSDIISCSIGRVSVGPIVRYQGEISPSIVFDLTQKHTKTAQASWYADGGRSVGRYQAEIAWINGAPRVTHGIDRLAKGEKRSLAPGAIAIFGSRSNIIELGGIDPSLHFLGTKKVIVPFNDAPDLLGPREVNVTSGIDTAFLMQSFDGVGEPIDDSLKHTDLEAPCGSVDVIVQEDQVTIVR